MHYLTDEELMAMPIGDDVVFDIEVYRNFLFIGFQFVNTDKYVAFYSNETHNMNLDKLLWMLNRYRFISFNGNHYDLPILALILTGATPDKVKRASDTIIQDGVRSYDFYKAFGLEPPRMNHIDLKEVCPLQGSLKLYAARLHAPTIENLPVDNEQYLTEEQQFKVGTYCLNDLALTCLIFNELREQIHLREVMGERYGLDLRSKSDAQIAEAVMKSELERVLGRIYRPEFLPSTIKFHYDPPSWVSFEGWELKDMLDDLRKAVFTVKPNGAVKPPLVLDKRTVLIGKGLYRMGVGGLHSSEQTQAVKSCPEFSLVDRDVASYYPSIILNEELYPEHLGPEFLIIYRNIVERRLAAKKAGTTDADSLKIVINGLFGKFGSRYSIVYSPKLLIQVTLTGQLALLMLIEWVEDAGIPVVSANTDGLVFKVPASKEELYRKIVEDWEKLTGFVTEETPYKALYSRDVNNYIAISYANSPKAKGAYSLPGGVFKFHKNPNCNIAVKAVTEYLLNETSVEDTVYSSQDIRDFVVVRRVNGGASHCGRDYGNVIRWYYGRHGKSAIHYTTNGNKVGNSEGAVIVQDLPSEFPDDVDYEKYIGMCEDILISIGAWSPDEGQLKLF